MSFFPLRHCGTEWFFLSRRGFCAPLGAEKKHPQKNPFLRGMKGDMFEEKPFIQGSGRDEKR